MDNLIQLAMQIIFCLLIAAILGAIIGYLLGKMSKCDKDNDNLDLSNKQKELNDYEQQEHSIKETLTSGINKTETIAGVGTIGAVDIGDKLIDKGDEFVNDVQETHIATTSVGQEVGIRPVSVEAPTDGEVDDLKEVSGIGLKIEEILNSLGIYYFEQISEWSSDNIDWIENYLSVKRRVKKEDWVGQAKLLSAGGQTEFSKKVKRGDNRNYQ